jgi:hypothetical protein
VEGSTTRLANGPQPELVAAGRKDTGGRRWGGLVRRGEGQRRLYRSRADPPSDHLTGGDARAGRQGRDRRSIAG